MPLDNARHQQQRCLRVLLVDDDQDNAEITGKLLHGMDTTQQIEHVTVDLLSDALAEISQSHYDLIMLDTGVADMPSPTAIHSLRDAFSYAPIIATLKYEDPELAAMWVGEGADECLFMAEVTEKELNRVVQYAIKRYHTYSELHQRSRTHHILNTLLSLSLQEIPFDKLLKECLEVILSAPMTEMLHQGAIFVTESGGQSLKMRAYSNLDQEIVALCRNVDYGRCLCGRAAQSGELQFADSIDHRHENQVDGMQPHGHYNVPILSKGNVLGVLVLYLNAGHVRSQDEEAFLRGVADTLAGIFERARTSDQLAWAHEQNIRLLSSLTSILIGVDEHGCISHWNEQAAQAFDLPAEAVSGSPIDTCPIGWDWKQVAKNIHQCRIDSQKMSRFEVRYDTKRRGYRLLSVCVTPFMGERKSHDGYLLIADDVTEQKQRESEMQQVQKLQSIGQLAAGIAHEINTPIQYVGDNIRFMREAFEDILSVISEEQTLTEAARNGKVSAELFERLDQRIDEVDLEYLQQEVPRAIQQTLDGVERVATIVRAMKEFSHPGSEEKTLTDINKAVESTATVASNVWKYHAEMQLALDPSLPQVNCLPGPINEVILNIIVNAAHAIEERVTKDGDKGLIRISTAHEDQWAVIRIADSGTGIPEHARAHVFDPFFTTKEVGHGTGQGLSLSHKIIVDQHDGELKFETESGVGTTFIVKLPLQE